MTLSLLISRDVSCLGTALAADLTFLCTGTRINKRSYEKLAAGVYSARSANAHASSPVAASGAADASGVKSSAATPRRWSQLGGKGLDDYGRILVNDRLEVQGVEKRNMFAIGDCASVEPTLVTVRSRVSQWRLRSCVWP